MSSFLSFFNSQIFRSFRFQGYFCIVALLGFCFQPRSTISAQRPMSSGLNVHLKQKHRSPTRWHKTETHTHMQTHMAVPRSRVANDVFTLVWGDCYFCAEPDNSIIHCGCWCTHFTSIRGGARCRAHGVFSMCACLQFVCICMCACCACEKTLQQQMNC